jgi:chemotaxis protein MotB
MLSNLMFLRVSLAVLIVGFGGITYQNIIRSGQKTEIFEREIETITSGGKEELEQAREEAEDLRGQLAEVGRIVADLRSENQDLQANLGEFADRVRGLEEESREGQLTRQGLDEQIRDFRTDLDSALLAKETELAGLRASYESLVETLRVQIRNREVDVEQSPEHLTIRLVDQVLFNSGSEILTEESRRTLDAVFEGLKPLKGGLVVIEGHADDRLIRPSLQSRFPSNWDLSLSRAAVVARYFQERGVSPKRLSVTGYSYYRPADSNLTTLGRSRNRRVEIKLIPIGLSSPEE